MDNIQELREKVQKNPKSTVFVRLADELKKTGQLDEAIEVLKNGIEHQPGYMSARVALGKIYLDKDMSDEAKAEFMQVVEAVPDNLFARKKLAELYRAEDDVELALEHYRKYLSMSPQDEEVQAICQELENTPAPEAQALQESQAKEVPTDPSKRPSPLMAATGEANQAPKAAHPQAAPADQAVEEAEINAEDVYLESSPYEEDEANGFFSSMSDEDAELERGSGDEQSLSLQEKSDNPSGAGVEFKGFDLEGSGTPDMMGQNDIDSMIEEVAGVPDEPAPELQAEAPVADEPATEAIEEVPSVVDESPVVEKPIAAEEAQEMAVAQEENGFSDIEVMDAATEEVEADEPVGVVEISEADADLGIELEGVSVGEDEQEDVGVVELSEDDTAFELEGFVDQGPEVLVDPEPESATSQTFRADKAVTQGQMGQAKSLEEQFAEADVFVEQEDYAKALDMYRRMLSLNPDNSEVRQRAEELRGLVKLLGKDRDILEERLLAFLGSLQRKKHEFFGSS